MPIKFPQPTKHDTLVTTNGSQTMFYVEEDIGSLRRVISQHATAKEAMTMAQAYAALHYVKYRWTVDWLYTATPLKDVPRPGARHILARLKNNPNYYSRKSKS